METRKSADPLIFIFITRLIDAIGFGIVMPVLPQLLVSMGSPNFSSADPLRGLPPRDIRVVPVFLAASRRRSDDRFGRPAGDSDVIVQRSDSTIC